ncbi:MAG: hypothetical protein HFJ75_09870 [Eggerthellaceae bacterium]|nr:hypothetical protein [Eggerthellaceae bacterium]
MPENNPRRVKLSRSSDADLAFCNRFDFLREQPRRQTPESWHLALDNVPDRDISRSATRSMMVPPDSKRTRTTEPRRASQLPGARGHPPNPTKEVYFI